MTKMLGGIEIIDQEGLKSLPQRAASAFAALPNTGASYKPLVYVGTQVAKGVNYVFVAQQTLVLAQPEYHIVLVTINEFDGKFQVVSIDRIV